MRHADGSASVRESTHSPGFPVRETVIGMKSCDMISRHGETVFHVHFFTSGVKFGFPHIHALE